MKETLTTTLAIKEARRCQKCSEPTCLNGCPLQINIPKFISCLAKGNFGEAYDIISEANNLPAICARVCPSERQCEEKCNMCTEERPVAIADLEGFIADFAHDNDLKPLASTDAKRGKIAIIGSGPAGLAAAGDLIRQKFAVTIFEAQSEPGGVLLFGIPEYRLPKDIVRKEISELQTCGVEIKVEKRAGIDFTIDDLFAEGYDAIFIGVGTALPRTLDIPGQQLSGILTATYFLRTVVLAATGKVDNSEIVLNPGDKVVVVGAGNVAMEAALTAVKHGAGEVTVVYHKGEECIKADRSAYRRALEAGVKFHFLQQPVAYFNPKQMRAVKNIRRRVQQADELNVAGILLQNIVKDKNGEYIQAGGQELLSCDCVILAIGQKTAPPIITSTKGIQMDVNGFVITKERPYGMTTRAGVFSSGDIVHGPATVVLAMKESKKVAEGIAQYVDAKKLLES
ncbi:MAG: FAD-dependent oxidoreductase [Phascolarctobacterium sp.]|nr:FAD-dependent oxidoreductase [Phascolarctobacterium sp.]